MKTHKDFMTVHKWQIVLNLPHLARRFEKTAFVDRNIKKRESYPLWPSPSSDKMHTCTNVHFRSTYFVYSRGLVMHDPVGTSRNPLQPVINISSSNQTTHTTATKVTNRQSRHGSLCLNFVNSKRDVHPNVAYHKSS